MSTYDAIAYTSLPYPRTHPDHLGAMARLRGVTAAAAEACTYLELGCGSGGNLLPIAAHLPDARVVGLDRSAGEIARAVAPPPNTRLIVGDATATALGTFDYVVAHGLFSWISEDARRALLSSIRRSLSPAGVAFVSYNVLPGWHLRGAFRAMLRAHTEGRPPAAAVQGARELLAFLDRTVPRGGAFRAVLDEERARLASADDGYLFHEHLEEHNHAVSVETFVDEAREAGLTFLCEADPLANPTAATRRALSTIAGEDPCAQERAFDWMRGRSFRCSLLVRDDATREPVPVGGWYLETHLERSEGGRFADGVDVFSVAPDVAADLERALEARPDAVPIDALSAEHVALHEGASLRLRRRGYGLSREGAPTELARAMARANARWVANRRHEPVALDDALTAALREPSAHEARELLHRLAFLG